MPTVMSFRLEVGALWWLGELLVGWSCHVSAYLDQNCLHSEVSLPCADAWELREVDLQYPISPWYSHVFSLLKSPPFLIADQRKAG